MICKKCNIDKLSTNFSKSGKYFNIWCKECMVIYSKEHYRKNKEKIIAYQKSYQDDNKEKLCKYRKQYRKDNKDKLREDWRQYRKNRCQVDTSFKILKNLRISLHHSLKNNQKSGHTLELLGCSINNLKAHLERKFLPGMNWKNWGKGKDKWNIDHIRPCSSFNLSLPEEQAKCFNYINLQPLWEEDNHKKSNKY